MDNRRDQILDKVKRELIGPDPVIWDGWPDLVQDNGEEVLVTDPPNTRYIAGILFPQKTTASEIEIRDSEEAVDNSDAFSASLPEDFSDDIEDVDINEYDREAAEELINRSNSYQQSAISLTVALSEDDEISVDISAGKYKKVKIKKLDQEEETDGFARIPINQSFDGIKICKTDKNNRIRQYKIEDENLQLSIVYRYSTEERLIYTFSLENTNESSGGYPSYDECYFQTEFKICSKKGFMSLPDQQKLNSNDEDFESNQMLYRSFKNFAIGHGCAANWDETDGRVFCIESAVFPSYEVKPIVPKAIDGVVLSMKEMSPSGSWETAFDNLQRLCDSYAEWIDQLCIEKNELPRRFQATAERHIDNCKKCHARMIEGLNILQENETVKTAFRYMNLAMLMQQLHYGLPLQKWNLDSHEDWILEDPVELPDVEDEDTWYDAENRVYGHWRPFQIAFVLINLKSMSDHESPEREIVDLIWFPTGGGKTEAYLGLSAFTIFYRRLHNCEDDATVILMRYTLRLLTAQQYERAASMICACEVIRSKNAELFGATRISIGLWVGSATTPNSMASARSQYNKIIDRGSDQYTFLMLKCPWCGAEMGIVNQNGKVELKGLYKTKVKRKQIIIFRCDNDKCHFSSEKSHLPLYITDDSVYAKKPTLLIGTVDKFAMLPFRPEAQSIFGFNDGKKVTAPSLIIQDELHLISGPLGSMVGHYETAISELSTITINERKIYPKIVASTATISRAKEQCNALYARDEQQVFQFPPSGLDARDSFFSQEDEHQKGRKYVGIISTSASDATTAIRTYATLLYAAKDIEVENENQRDPYWTNVGYYNSIRELGQAATWIRADIEQHLDVIYKRKLYDKRFGEDYGNQRRYIYKSTELTSRIKNEKVTESLESLGQSHPAPTDAEGKTKYSDRPIDICLATNMISVGLDVPRLGLMTVSGQPKTTSEYIQATSRVGRSSNKAPGIIFVLYRPGRPRDKSFYENFREYHSRLYCHVEPTSVTPFSAPVRERALHALLVTLLRLTSDKNKNEAKPQVPSVNEVKMFKQLLSERIGKIDPKELEATLKHVDLLIDNWDQWDPILWQAKVDGQKAHTSDMPLIFMAGKHRHKDWGNRSFETPTSMRNVDAQCEAEVIEKYPED